MKANSKRKVFGDAVDLLMGDMEEVTMPRGVQMVPVKNIQAFHDHPFHLYEGERLEDMIASVKEHGVLNPVIVTYHVNILAVRHSFRTVRCIVRNISLYIQRTELMRQSVVMVLSGSVREGSS